MSSALLLIPHLETPSYGELAATEMTLEELCRGLHGQDFSRTAQQRFVDILSDTREAHLVSKSSGTRPL